jgi:transcriptional regulator with GAF, ATPase, and Fis domain
MGMDEPRDLGSGTWVGRHPGGGEAVRLRKCRLEVIAGPDSGCSAVFAAPRIVIGRGGGDLVLNDRKVSALHVEIRLEDQGYRLRDLGSTNGTFVRGMRVVEVFIDPGTVIALGESGVRFTPLPDTVELALWGGSRLCGLRGKSTIMRRLFESIEQVANTEATVLITGETGSGKDLVAEAIQERSPRAGKPFVVLDCGAAPAGLFEDQLFGHEVGAFTGADRATAGVFETASGGTLFLDEIGELPLETQPKLLRAVETRRIRRVGGNRTIDCDVRLVAATNRDLSAEVNRKTFRPELYFRIMVTHLFVPPLREHPEDIELLVDHFLAELAPGGAAALPEGFLEWARAHTWPGNVRELRNAVERAVVTRGLPGPEDAPGFFGVGDPLRVDLDVPFREAKRRVVDEFDRRYVRSLLDKHEWNIASAARAAGLDRMSIYKMLRRLDIRRLGD